MNRDDVLKQVLEIVDMFEEGAVTVKSGIGQ